MKYYFISYAWRRRGQEYRLLNAVEDTHPLLWLVAMNDRGDEEYAIISYQEISQEDFQAFKGEIG
jgi:hypothetical protein